MSHIDMGNDELILYIRKHNTACIKSTADLGDKIWEWIKRNEPNAIKVAQSQACRWGNTGSFIASDDLPKTASQFRFDRAILPSLYDFLDTL